MNYHGEYKVPGGKLVVVDFEVTSACFANMRITGDFFVFPEDAIDALARSINGMDVNASANDLQLAMSRAMGNDVELLGFGPVDVVAAIRRALA